MDYVILAQTLPFINFSDNLDNYQYEDNEVLLYVPLNNMPHGLYRGLKKSLANIVLRGDEWKLSICMDLTKRNLKVFTV